MTETAADAIREAKEYYVNQRTGEWYDDGTDEVRIVRALVEALERCTATGG